MSPARERPVRYADPDALADAIVERVGPEIVLGLPLGLGKANHVANALYARAERDPDVRLRILTALTLTPPGGGSELERRFLEPLAPRLFGGYPELAYARAERAGTLPPNVSVSEFYLQPGRWLGVPEAQQHYISVNYTQVFDVLRAEGMNVVGQLVAPPQAHDAPQRYSLSCNPDLTAELLARRQTGDQHFLLVGQVNRELPFMHGEADRSASDFDLLLDDASVGFPLFTPPHEPVASAHHAIGLHVARLVPDGGTLQIGIGSIGDAIAHALRLRHRDNGAFRALLEALGADSPRPECHAEPFVEGLYGASEMLVEGFLALLHAGVLKREVDGYVLHAAFFLGSPVFYDLLAALPPADRERIAMMPVTFTNELYRDEAGKRAARRGARFVNSAMMATLDGAVVSDGLEDGRVVSGVGGQYNFVAQAFALDGARSIITLPATRRRNGRVSSNIRWRYGHVTIPRHLRDIVVTEYGVADLRARSDADVIAAMLNIADSRFQPGLLKAAQQAGKLPADHEIPEAHRHNTPERIAAALGPFRETGHLEPFPLGTTFSAEEQRLLPALQALRECGTLERLRMVLAGLRERRPAPAVEASLARMGLGRPTTLKARVYRALLTAALR